MDVWPSVRMKQSESHQRDCRKISYFRFLLKPVDTFRFWLKSEKIIDIVHEDLRRFMWLFFIKEKYCFPYKIGFEVKEIADDKK
jgi:hypothetical protein